MSELNIYQKLQEIKCQLLRANLKKSGKNKFAGFDYYELADIMPTIIELCKEHNLFTHITFSNEEATLTIVNTDKPEEAIKYTSPMRELELKGCNQIQALGGIETYQRRYLLLNAFDIIESDMFDAVVGDEKKEEKKVEPKEKPRFNKEHLERLSNNKEYLQKFTTSDDLIKDILKSFKISTENRLKIADLRANI